MMLVESAGQSVAGELDAARTPLDGFTHMGSFWLVVAALSAAVPAPLAPASSDRNDYNLSTDARETVMVLARSDADFKNAAIFTSVRDGAGWREPAPIEFTDKAYNDSDPWLTPDGNTLYFISDRPAPGRDPDRHDYDIWRATRSGSGWSAPEHLGAAINSPAQELGPEFHDGRLYFASARRSGIGGLDIYSASSDGPAFRAAVLLDGPFNGPTHDSDFTLAPDGSAALYWRSVSNQGALHVVYRTADAWSEPLMLGPDVNIGPFNFTPSFAPDGKTIRYASTRPRDGQPHGYADVYEAALPDHSAHRVPISR